MFYINGYNEALWSILKEDYSFIYVILAIIFQALSGVCSKYASTSIDNHSLISIVSNIFYIASIICLIIQAFVWQMSLRQYDLSFIYPFISLVNFVILFLSYILFNESITVTNILGLLIISAGIYLLSRSVNA